VIDEGEKHFTLIQSEMDIDTLDFSLDASLAILTQTTLSVDDTQSLVSKIQEKYPNIALPKSGDICYATTNRQKAVKVLAEKCDVVIVVGSSSSSNSSKLRDVAEKYGARSYRIDDASEIDLMWLQGAKNIGITA
jgi:4-hydroxy-3-methylbut-2-en-1-yl diphosphate reductase